MKQYFLATIWVLGSVVCAATPASTATLFVPELKAGASAETAKAIDLLEAGRIEDARKRLIDIIRKNRTDSTARLALGYIYLDKQPKLAALISVDILSGKPRHQQALDLMSAAYAQMRTQTRSVIEERDLRLQEIDALGKIAARHPGWTEPIYRLASQQIAVERLDPDQLHHLMKAVLALETLVATLTTENSTPEVRATAWFQLGRALKHVEDAETGVKAAAVLAANYKRAVKCFQTVLKIDPRRIDAVGEMILIYRSVGDQEAALAIVRQSLARDYNGFTGQTAIFAQAKLSEMEGVLLLELARTDEAETVFVKTLKMDPQLVGTALSLAQLQQVGNRQAEAERTLAAIVKAEPRSLDGLLALATFLENANRPEEAMAIHWSLAAIPPAEAIAMGMQPSPQRHRAKLRYRSATRLAGLELASGNSEKALRVATLARSFQEPDTDLQMTVALIFEALGRRTSAIEQLQSVFDTTQSSDVQEALRSMQLRAKFTATLE